MKVHASRMRRGHLTLPHPVKMLIFVVISYHRYIFVGSSDIQSIGVYSYGQYKSKKSVQFV